MCLAARVQKKFSSDGRDCAREGSFRILSQRARVARELIPPQVVRGREASACSPSERGSPENRPTAGGAGEENFRILSQLSGDARELLSPLGAVLAAVLGGQQSHSLLEGTGELALVLIPHGGCHTGDG